MEQSVLQEWISDPGIRRSVLAGHVGAASIGIGDDPEYPGHFAILVRVVGARPTDFVKSVRVAGEDVRVIVRESARAARLSHAF